LEPDLITHTIQSGDTLLKLAAQYDVPMAAIQLQNHMGDSTVLHTGDTIAVPRQAPWEGASRFWIVRVVREGETLTAIADAYGLDPEALQAANRLADADLIAIGQQLVLPLDRPIAEFTPTSTPTSTPTLPPSPLPERTPEPVVPPPQDVTAWPRELARLINETRAAHGLPPLAYNETLAFAAQGQSNDCAQRSWCSHTGSDGADVRTRILRAGYDASGWAECWAQSQSPQGAVDMWMDEVPPEDPHRRTLLSTWLSEVGVGVAQTDWGYYFIADFGRRRADVP
jgi:uncharacterized protein YkwD